MKTSTNIFMKWITVKEASELIGKSPVTIRRAINEHSSNVKGSLGKRSCFKYKQGASKNRKIWLIEKKSLLNYYGLNAQRAFNDRSSTITNDHSDLLNHIETLTKQLETQNKQVADLTERLKEAQYIIAGEQQAKKLLEDKLSKMDRDKSVKDGFISGVLKKFGL